MQAKDSAEIGRTAKRKKKLEHKLNSRIQDHQCISTEPIQERIELYVA